MVYPPGFRHHHHHVGDDGFVVDYNCDDNVGEDDDDDHGVTLVYEDAKIDIDFVAELGDFKQRRNLPQCMLGTNEFVFL